MALHHPQGVVRHVLARHKPGRVFAAPALCAFFFDAAYAQTLALAQGVKAQALVAANHTPCIRLDGAWGFGDVAVQELPERPLANEANAG